MVYVDVLVSAWLALVAVTALRPRRRGRLAALAYPIGWIAGELPLQAILLELALLGLVAWTGWPVRWWEDTAVSVLALVVVGANLALWGASLGARRVVARALAESERPLSPAPDVYGKWWRTLLQLPVHPRAMTLVRDVPYGPEARHRLDLWYYGTPEGAPVVLYLHGGAWIFGDKREQGRPMLHEFAARGWLVVTANYRLAPAHPWPAQIEDVTRTLGWLKQEVARYGGDPDRIVVAGGSAGGHLAALLALSGEDPTWRPEDLAVEDWSVRGAIPLYGVLEMTGDEAHWRGLGAGLRHLLEHRVVQRPYEGHEALYRAISPLHRITPDSPPFLVVQGVTDTLVEVNVARGFVEEFRAASPSLCYYVELPLTQHAFDVTASPRTSAVTRAAVAFAEAVAHPRRPLDDDLLAAYAVPPTALAVAGEDPVALAAREGDYVVVTSDHPNSVLVDDQVLAASRAELDALVARRGWRSRESVARDPSGEWPDEHGRALWIDDESAGALARRFGQVAYYRVTPRGVEVVPA